MTGRSAGVGKRFSGRGCDGINSAGVRAKRTTVRAKVRGNAGRELAGSRIRWTG